jgi:hypothetical protein
MSTRTAERLIRAELRKKFGPRYRSKFEIRTSESNRALSVHWGANLTKRSSKPSEARLSPAGPVMASGSSKPSTTSEHTQARARMRGAVFLGQAAPSARGLIGL